MPLVGLPGGVTYLVQLHSATAETTATHIGLKLDTIGKRILHNKTPRLHPKQLRKYVVGEADQWVKGDAP